MLTKVLAVCLISAVLSVLLKQYKSEFAFLCTAAAAVTVFLIVADYIKSAAAEFSAVVGKFGNMTFYFKVALKALGIAYITEFCADMCRDFGQSLMAAKAEFAGRAAIFVLAVPLLASLLELALKVAKV